MKYFYLLLMFIISASATQGQFKLMAESNSFPEPDGGVAKIFQFKNGTTVFLHFNGNNGINIKTYDASHKLKAENHIDAPSFELKDAKIESAFTIKEDVALFISGALKGDYVLTRVLINSSNGKLIKEERILDVIEQRKIASIPTFARGNTQFIIKKSATGDTYAFMNYKSYETDRNKCMEVIFYNADHIEISRSNFTPTNQTSFHLRFLDMAVINDQQAVLLIQAHGTPKKSYETSELLMSVVGSSGHSIDLKALNFTSDIYVRGGIVRYNPADKKLYVFANGASPDKYLEQLARIDITTGTIEKMYNTSRDKGNEAGLTAFGKKMWDYWRAPEDLYFNDNGNISVAYEKIGGGTKTPGPNAVSYAFLENLSLSTFNPAGEEISTYVIAKSTSLVGYYCVPFYHALLEDQPIRLSWGNQFKTYSYLNTPGKAYILTNDIEKNAENIKKGKVKRVQVVAECDAFYYLLTGKTTVPERDFVFGKSEDKGDYRRGMFSISDYDSAKNIYATLLLGKGSRSENAKIVWLQPQ